MTAPAPRPTRWRRPPPPPPPAPLPPHDPSLLALPHVRAALARCGVGPGTPGHACREGDLVVWRAMRSPP